MLFSGIFVSADGIPPYFDWIKWFSPMKYAFAAFMINEYSGLAMTCEADEWVARPDCPREMENGVAKMLDGAPVFKKCFCPVTDGKQADACARRRAAALRSPAPQRPSGCARSASAHRPCQCAARASSVPLQGG
jgi:hypothetical protein